MQMNLMVFFFFSFSFYSLQGKHFISQQKIHVTSLAADLKQASHAYSQIPSGYKMGSHLIGIYVSLRWLRLTTAVAEQTSAYNNLS